MSKPYRKPYGKQAWRAAYAATDLAGHRENHDALERSVVKLAAAKFKLVLYKADATATFRKRDGSVLTRVTPGIPDLIGALRPTGRFIGIEIKTGKAQPRPNQERVHREIMDGGGIVIVVRSMRDADEFLDLLTTHEREKAGIIAKHDSARAATAPKADAA